METHSLTKELRETQLKRVKNGTIIKYKDGEEYFSSPGFTTVKLAGFKTYLKQYKINL